ncbi:HIT family protein [Dongia soli]|uniref:HIT family protein n=1 Tax=Dongia soli TaxID=600628 RepID=A0ABU5EBE6_9PROT|nr:HIT family protein [Dongia soli]MDY0882890.1 HIT family protein [Dongia soli]
MSEFALHPQLAKDTFEITDWPLCRVLRMNDTTYPWLILVPRRRECREITDLLQAERHRLMDEISQASDALQRECNPTKVNIGALGNMVPQLHIHVIGRFSGDPAWPKPVWGFQPAQPFEQAEREREATRWQQLLASPQAQ